MTTKHNMRVALTALKKNINKRVDNILEKIETENETPHKKQQYTMLLHGLVSELDYYHGVVMGWKMGRMGKAKK